MPLCDLLLRLAEAGVVRAQWTERIIDEVIDSLRRRRPNVPEERLERRRAAMRDAAEDCLVYGYEGLIDGLTLPDPDDRHVVAAAIRAGAQAIITSNVRDFPTEALTQYGIEVLHPDEFVLDLIDLAPGRVLAVLHEQAAGLSQPRMSVDEVIDKLEGNGLVRAAAQLRRILGQDR